jgi:iron complex transport system substrate-binding protein
MARDSPRVVSLLPSATEIVAALGVTPVATSHECDHPPAVADRPSVVESRVDADAGSGEIDAQVRAAEGDGGVYAIDRETLAAVDPDLVIAQGICDVCAVDTVLVEDAVADLGLECPVLTTDPHSLADVFEDVRRIGAAIDRPERATTLLDRLHARVDAVADRAAPTAASPSVAVLDWLDPVMVAGHWVPELVEMAGGRYDLADPGDASTPREWAELREYDPDVLVAAPCGFALDQSRANAADLTDRDGWQDLRAVRTDRTYALDGHHLVNRPGPRLVETLELLAALLRPDRVDDPESWQAEAFP